MRELYFDHEFKINVTNWNEIYHLPFKVTIDCKLREFQFKILHNILYTNARLSKMNIPTVDNALCSFCKNKEETLLHILHDCQHVQLFWEAFFMLWGQKLKLRVRPKIWQIILGDPKLSSIVNFLLLIGKRYIYICRCKKTLPKFTAYKRFVNSIQKTEYHIALRKDKIFAHNKKWRIYSTNIHRDPSTTDIHNNDV